MRQVTGSMANVVRGMDGAMKSMDLEKVRRDTHPYHKPPILPLPTKNSPQPLHPPLRTHTHTHTHTSSLTPSPLIHHRSPP